MSNPSEAETDERPERGYQRWSTATKRTVTLIGLLFLALVAYQFRALWSPLALAFLIAFILNPIVDFLDDRVGMHRNLAAGLVFFLVIAALLGLMAAPVAAVPSVQRAIISAQLDVRQIIDDIDAFLSREIEIFGFDFDLTFLADELSTALRRLVESLAQGALDTVVSVAQGLFWVVFILIIAFYFAKDAHHIAEHLDGLAPPGYREDATRLRRQLIQVWNSFLRGELLLGTVVGVTTGLVTAGLGLPFPWALGLFAGFLELIPRFGPVIAAIPAVLLALIQGSAFIPLGSFWFAVVVAGAYSMIQFVENNFFVPRILGSTLDLHPLAVLIAVLAGGHLAGVLGVFLAAPMLATLRVLGRYILARLYDRDPFAALEEDKEPPPSEPSMVEKVGEAALVRLQDTVKQAIEHAESSDSSGTGSR
ncbi:MAG: AI-2E family transporter [Chloroflexota bacterium]